MTADENKQTPKSADAAPTDDTSAAAGASTSLDAETPRETAASKPASRRKATSRSTEPEGETTSPLDAAQGAPGKASVVDASGAQVETRELPEALFAVPADINTLHLVVRAEQAARRRGTASTKTRAEVAGSTAKLYRQKGTGRARAGSAKSPIRTGGGVAFGPRPRTFDIKVNRKVVRQSLAMALSNRAENGHVFVAADLKMDEPSTKAASDFFVKLDVAAPVLVVTDGEPTVIKSVRNLPYAEASEVGALSTEMVLRARSLVLTEKAFAALSQA